MAGKKDQYFTLIVPNLTKEEGKELRNTLMRETKKIAPKAKGSIRVGKMERFRSVMQSCKKALKGE